MDLRRVGAFISVLRKEKNLTQKELSKKIGVTDKAISRWETGRGFPDVSILKSLSETLDVSISEIVNGEKIPLERVDEKTDTALLEALAYSKKMSRKAVGVVMLLIGIAFLVYPLIFAAKSGFSIVPIIGLAAVIVSAVLLFTKIALSVHRIGALRRKKRFAGAVSLILLCTALALEALPYGAVLIFADGPDSRIRETFAYFDIVNFGYAHFFPVITAALTVVISLISVIAFIGSYRFLRLQNAGYICSIIAFLASILSSVMFGAAYVTAIGVIISILLLGATVLQMFSNRSAKI